MISSEKVQDGDRNLFDRECSHVLASKQFIKLNIDFSFGNNKKCPSNGMESRFNHIYVSPSFLF